MSGCEACDFIGPELDTLEADRRAAHRALHDFIQTVVNLVVVPLLPVMEWFTEWTEARVRRSAMHSGQDEETAMSVAVPALAVVGLCVLSLWALANVVGWLSVQDIPNRPWNWRVLVGVFAYYPWLDRRPR